MAPLFLLAFGLSLDNFRASFALGMLRISFARQVRTALTFGFWDAASPLAGLFIGHLIASALGPWTDRIGPLVLAVYGLYTIYRGLKQEVPEEVDDRWILFGLPLSLSLDNLVAGTGLGLLGFPGLLSAAVFGSVTVVMSLVGLRLGQLFASRLPVRSEFLAGLALLVSAVVLAVRP